MSKLRNLTISLTLTCNEACAHCWVSAGPMKSPELTSDEIESVIRQAAELGAEHVKFTGGEPLIRPDLPELIEVARSLGMRVSIETNGLLLSRRMLDRLRGSGPPPHLYVSIDGATPTVHDEFRERPGALNRTLSNLRVAREVDFYFSVHTVVRHQNMHQLGQIHELVRSLGASQHKLILSIHELGRGSDIHEESQIGPDEILDVLDRLPAQEFWDYGWHPEASRETKLMTTLPPAFQPDGAKVSTCGWGQSYLSVLSNGAVALCHGLYDVDEATAGNVRVNSLADIWERSALFKATRSWKGSDLSGVCGNCQVSDQCRGLCRANAIGHYGDIKAPYPMCQLLYEAGMFPTEMLVDSAVDSTYLAMV